jgi:hypothetical protein
VVHADAAASRGLRLEGLRAVLSECRGANGRNIAVGFLQVEADLAVRDTVDKDLVVLGDLLDRAPDRARGLVEEGQRVEQARRGPIADVVGDLF